MKYGFGQDSEPAWPDGDGGQPEPMALLAKKEDVSLDLTITVELLKACGIPVRVVSEANDAFVKVYLGERWSSGSGCLIFVPESMLEEAQAILSAPPVFDEGDSL